MNAFDREMNRKPKNPKRYTYKTYHSRFFWAVPLMMIMYHLEQWCEAIKYGAKWSDKRTERILSHAFLKGAHINSQEGKIYRYFCTWCFYWCNYCRPWDRWYCNKYNSTITKYLREQFEMDGYTKTVEDEDNGEWFSVDFDKKA